jgi:medium-chain acyl-[acyl-carrier-protein] hydrolase
MPERNDVHIASVTRGGCRFRRLGRVTAPPAVRLACFPFAGGGSIAYRPWARRLPARVEVLALELPGRETRVDEAPYRVLDALAEDAAAALAALADEPLALFGHSFGALTAYEVVRRLRDDHGIEPSVLFASGDIAPSTQREDLAIDHLSDGQFLELACSFGGLPDEITGNKDLMAVVLPALRADFEAYASYEHRPHEPLRCRIVATGGTNDALTDEASLRAWGAHTSGPTFHRLFPGGHFYLRPDPQPLLDEIIRHLDELHGPLEEPGGHG